MIAAYLPGATSAARTSRIPTLPTRNGSPELSAARRSIVWRVKAEGFHVLRPLIKLADGTLLVGDHILVAKYVYGFNTSQPPFKDNVPLRKALALALDAVTVVRNLLTLSTFAVLLWGLAWWSRPAVGACAGTSGGLAATLEP